MTTTRNTPLVLVIRDGWGTNPNSEHDPFNAVKIARTPVADRIANTYPTTLIATSGEDVGLTTGTMGNSEVGHQNIGAGRVVYQDAVRISIACRDNELEENQALTDAIAASRDNDRPTHLIGINSDAGVHGQLEHLRALVQLCKQLGQSRVYIHLFADGRDTGPFTGKNYARHVEGFCNDIGLGRVVSVVGRYWAMDRDNRWERVKKAYELLTGRAEPALAHSPTDAFQSYYDKPDQGLVGDEFVRPTAVGEDWKDTRIKDHDAVIYFNYRGDRPRELCSAFLLPEFHHAEELQPSPDTGERGFDRGPRLDLRFVLMTPYSERLASLAPVAFPKPPKMEAILGQHLSSLGINQFRCAETEKFPHVTFFFNDYRDQPFEGEHREILQSPKVPTYDLQPEMSARAVADAVLARLHAPDCEPLIVVNFANGDMVGHTGNLDAAVAACETVDQLVGELLDAALARGGAAIVTADHGNAEQMFSPENDSPHTAHTTYPVPLVVVGEPFQGRALRSGGRLADIAPTCLDIMGLDKPDQMTGRSLLE